MLLKSRAKPNFLYSGFCQMITGFFILSILLWSPNKGSRRSAASPVLWGPVYQAGSCRILSVARLSLCRAPLRKNHLHRYTPRYRSLLRVHYPPLLSATQGLYPPRVQYHAFRDTAYPNDTVLPPRRRHRPAQGSPNKIRV